MSSCPKKTKGWGSDSGHLIFKCTQTKFTEKLIVDEPIPYKQCVFLDVGVSRYICINITYIYIYFFFWGGAGGYPP